ncbi:PPE family protein [Mycobacterium sp. THU-M104]|uniref:PPE family protein n=1 Tax=Mycobacterium sp. THU-M104 TaxID=3410515 RepID=UPI003B9B3D66
MDFGALPPEVNSGRLYTGPGAAPLLAAATAWEHLADELNFAAAAYRAVIANLTSSGWQGASSAAMARAAGPYLAWLQGTAAQAEQTAEQAKTAAAAYEAAFAMTVPPPLIAANRVEVAALIAGNFFGQNSPAIAAAEADYDEMWAHNAAVMYGYAGSSAAASQVAPFHPAPRTTNPTGSVAQSATLAQAGAGRANTVAGLGNVLAQPAAASNSAAPSSGVVPTIAGQPISTYGLEGGTSALSVNDEAWRLIALASRLTGFRTSALRDFAQGIGPFDPIFGIPTSSGVSSASAVMGRASNVGALSIPPTWTVTAAQGAEATAATLPVTAAAETAGMPGTMLFGETLLGTLAGRVISAAAAKGRDDKTTNKNKVVPRSPAAG